MAEALLELPLSEIRAIAARYGGLRVRVFGSRARGDQRTSSDLDLLIDLAHGRTLLDLVAIKQDIEDLTGLHVDAITEAGLSPYLRDSILKDAVPL